MSQNWAKIRSRPGKKDPLRCCDTLTTEVKSQGVSGIWMETSMPGKMTHRKWETLLRLPEAQRQKQKCSVCSPAQVFSVVLIGPLLRLTCAESSWQRLENDTKMFRLLIGAATNKLVVNLKKTIANYFWEFLFISQGKICWAQQLWRMHRPHQSLTASLNWFSSNL